MSDRKMFWGIQLTAFVVVCAIAAQDTGTSLELGETPPFGPVEPSAPIKPADITASQENTRKLITTYLEQRGWQHVADTPGGYWLWTKEIGGKVYQLATDDAMNAEFYVEITEDEAKFQEP